VPPSANAEIKDAFAALSRSLKRISIYRHDVAHFREYLQPALAALNSVLERSPQITVQVEPTGLYVGDEAIYTEPAREWSLCYRLHRDGVRALFFKRGLPMEELGAFVRAAVPDPQGGGHGREDAVTEMWKADMTCIGYAATTGWRTEAIAAWEGALEAVAEASARARIMLERAGFSRADEDAWALAQPVDTPRELAPLITEEAWAELARRATHMLLGIFTRGYAGRDQAPLEETLGRLFDEALERGDTDALAQLIDSLPALVVPELPDDRREAGAQVMVHVGARLADPRRLARLIELAGAEPRTRPTLIGALRLMPAGAGVDLLYAVTPEAIPEVRAAVARAAAGRARGLEDTWSTVLHNAPREVALLLLEVLSNAPFPDPASVAEWGLQNPALDVQVAAVRAIGADPMGAVPRLAPLLDNREPRLRVSAAEALARAEPDAAAAALLSVMERNEFNQREKAEQVAFYRSLGALHNNEGFAFLGERLTSPRKGLLRKEQAEEAQLFAVQGLAAEASERAARVLENEGKPERKHAARVAAACRAASRHVREEMKKRADAAAATAKGGEG
jgi:hypothetical protein